MSHIVTYSLEKLVHFRCSACQQWWAIGDAPTNRHYFCPWCGVLHFGCKEAPAETDLERFKRGLEGAGIFYMAQTKETGYTYIVLVSDKEAAAKESVNLATDRFFEFDRQGGLASYP